MEMVMEDALMGVDDKRVQKQTVVFNMAGCQNICILES
jgi:hypothetical protein